MFNIKDMLQRELYFCDSFTDKTVTDCGILYHNVLNPKSHDSNHALILDVKRHPDKAIRYITQFYRSHGLVPRIYPSYIDNELEVLKPYLESADFKLTMYPAVYMLFPHSQGSCTNSSMSINRILRVSDDSVDLMNSDGDNEMTVKVLEKHLSDPNFHLLGFLNAGKYISTASVKVMSGYSRIDDVMTHPKFRGRHYATELMKYLVGYHRSISDNYLYLWATNPIAIRLYQNVGFRTVDVGRTTWSAHLEPKSVIN